MMAEVVGTDRRIALCREMTKLNEEVLHLSLADSIAHFEKNPPRGEFVLVLEGASDKGDVFWQNLTVAEHVAYYTDTMGLEKMAAVKAAARDRGVAKNVIYKELL
jgi:16S rRNA (cytidine1402-2'-O)-methyltransferase